MRVILSKTIVLALLGLASCVGLRVALHAQVSPKSGFVVGSVVTTDGLRRALRAHPLVDVAEVFYPFDHARLLSAEPWDLLIIEGWFEMVASLLHEMRSLFPAIVVFFYSLDPDFPSVDVLLSLDVDAYLTNSKSFVSVLLSSAPARYVPLGVDPEEFVPAAHVARRGVVYVGAGGAMAVHKRYLLPMLHGAAAHNLSVYGNAWESVPSVAPYCRGVLPRHELAAVYQQARFVIGSTTDVQRGWGMINNRIYEALATGAILISDNVSEVVEGFAGAVFVVSSEQQTHELLTALERSSEEELEELSKRSRAAIAGKHTWANRVVDILHFLQEVKESKRASIHRCLRPNCPRLGVVVSAQAAEDSDFKVVLRSLTRRLARDAHITYYDSPTALSSLTPQRLLQHNLLLAFFFLGDEVDSLMASRERPQPLYEMPLRTIGYPLGAMTEAPRDIIEQVQQDGLAYFDVLMYRDERSLWGVWNWITLLTTGRSLESLEDKDFTTIHRAGLPASHPQLPHLQHAFGIGNAPSSQQRNRTSDAVLMLNTWMPWLASHPGVLVPGAFFTANSVMVLHGGHWSAWQDVLPEGSNVSRVIHVPDGPFSEDMLDWFLTVRTLYILNPNSQDSFPAWPLVLGAVSNCQIVLLKPSLVATTLAGFGVDQWTSAYGLTGVKKGLTRTMCLGCGRSRTSVALSATARVDSDILLQLQTREFRIGRDGLLCILLDEVKVICVSREALQVSLRFRSSLQCPEKYNESAVHSNVHLHSSDESEELIIRVDGRTGCLVVQHNLTDVHEMDAEALDATYMQARHRNPCGIEHVNIVTLQLISVLRGNVYGDDVHRSEPSLLTLCV